MKNIIITGGHTGIGLALTKRLVQEGHRVGLIVHKAERAKGIKGISDVFVANLSNQARVQTVANDIINRWGVVDILFNNAGVVLDEVYWSVQNNEMHFEMNTLSPYLLTKLLKPALDRSQAPVVINTVIDGLHTRRKLQVSKLTNPSGLRPLFNSYLQSKLALMLLMSDLAEQWKNIRILNVTPGQDKKSMSAGPGSIYLLHSAQFFMRSPPSKGANLLHEAAFGTYKIYPSGRYIQRRRAHAPKSKLSNSDKMQLLVRINFTAMG